MQGSRALHHYKGCSWDWDTDSEQPVGKEREIKITT